MKIIVITSTQKLQVRKNSEVGKNSEVRNWKKLGSWKSEKIQKSEKIVECNVYGKQLCIQLSNIKTIYKCIFLPNVEFFGK